MEAQAGAGSQEKGKVTLCGLGSRYVQLDAPLVPRISTR